MLQTKRVRVYRDNKKIFTLEPDQVAGFVASSRAQKIHRTLGQIFRIDLAEKHYSSFASQTVYGQRKGCNTFVSHLANRDLIEKPLRKQ